MKKYGFKILAALIIVNAMGCGNAQQNSHNNSKMDKIKQKITPCLWVETTDAKAVADYYLSLFEGWA